MDAVQRHAGGKAMPIFHLVVLLLEGAGLLVLVLGIRALRRRRPLRFTIDVLLGLLLLASGALLLTLGVATRGYQAFTREAVAARVTVTPADGQRFTARFRFPDGREAEYALSGDQLYVDARILKWKPLANFFGLHTAYELDRVAGRYEDLAREQTRSRTVFSLADDTALNIFRLRQRYAVLAPLLDAEYGSGTFGRVSRPATFEIRVSTTGLLIREAPPGR
jgi:hypothetical protein